MGKRANTRSLLTVRWKGMLAYLVAGLVAALLSALGLAELDEHVSHAWVKTLDRSVQAWIHAHSSARLTPVMETLTWIGGPVIAVPICLVVAVVLWRRRMRRGALVLVNSMAGAALLDNALKLHFKRLRPEVPWSLVSEHSFSFPSGHSIAAVVLYGTLLYLLLRWWNDWEKRALAVLFAFAMAFGIGYSRVYLGAHWPSDVAAGYACGAVWLAAVIGADMVVRRELPEWVGGMFRR